MSAANRLVYFNAVMMTFYIATYHQIAQLFPQKCENISLMFQNVCVCMYTYPVSKCTCTSACMPKFTLSKCLSETWAQDYKRFLSTSRCSTHNLCSEMK